ncbi:MAG: MFS transporter [Desulfovibrio sp. MES5]|uniref:MFS transporter n=1 Tax=Desulfovibrio sp. MES5 TaxID=1899016 RepID=UPI000B9C833D|nr:MFS transporter [Desulfovibrio sp. MES5]OXS29763.1 MAG: MFS transporter [Desulfovibrio sp. MES5]
MNDTSLASSDASVADAQKEFSPSEFKTVVTASSIGTMVEWYDFTIYGTASALVFNKIFFPAIDPFLGTIAAFGSAAVGLFARPFGGAIFGHFGDKLGRKNMLMATMMIMGIGTFCIGLLPDYNTIGIWAPILLVILRILQGIGIGGEWGGAALMVIESAPQKKRGFFGSFVQFGYPLGLLLSTIIFSLVSLLPEEQFLKWGWRIPFILSIALVSLGMFIRSKVRESPVFAKAKAQKKLVKQPVIEVFKQHPKEFFSAIGLKASEVSWIYVLTIFIVAYVSNTLNLPKSVALNGVLLGACLELFTLPFFGWLSDKIGRRILYITGAVASIICAYPLFILVGSGDSLTIMLAIALFMNICHAPMYGPQAAYFPELFGTSVRMSGASFGVQVAAAVFGGLSPIICAVLLKVLDGSNGISVYLISLAVVTLISAILTRETKGENL